MQEVNPPTVTKCFTAADSDDQTLRLCLFLQNDTCCKCRDSASVSQPPSPHDCCLWGSSPRAILYLQVTCSRSTIHMSVSWLARGGTPVRALYLKPCQKQLPSHRQSGEASLPNSNSAFFAGDRRRIDGRAFARPAPPSLSSRGQSRCTKLCFSASWPWEMASLRSISLLGRCAVGFAREARLCEGVPCRRTT